MADQGRVASIERIPVPVETRAPDGITHAHLVGDLVIDPAGRTPELDAALEERQVEHVAVTHTHSDHVRAVAHYAQETGATVWAHASHVDRFERAAGVTPDEVYRGGDAIGPARVVETPGHAPDHVGFAVQSVESVSHFLCGDLAVADGSVVVGVPDGDVRSYLTSLRRVRTHGYATLRPSHGPVIDEPIATLDRLIEHRLDRERRVLEAVRGGATDVSEAMADAYEKDLTGVEDLALVTTAAHLEKLARAGRIDRSWLGTVSSLGDP